MKKKQDSQIFRFHYEPSLRDIDIEADNLREAVRKLTQDHPDAGVGYMVLKKDESGCWYVIE